MAHDRKVVSLPEMHPFSGYHSIVLQTHTHPFLVYSLFVARFFFHLLFAFSVCGVVFWQLSPNILWPLKFPKPNNVFNGILDSWNLLNYTWQLQIILRYFRGKVFNHVARARVARSIEFVNCTEHINNFAFSSVPGWWSFNSLILYSISSALWSMNIQKQLYSARWVCVSVYGSRRMYIYGIDVMITIMLNWIGNQPKIYNLT